MGHHRSGDRKSKRKGSAGAKVDKEYCTAMRQGEYQCVYEGKSRPHRWRKLYDTGNPMGQRDP